MITFPPIIHGEDGIFVANCPKTGTVSQGSSREEAISNLKEATGLYLEEFPAVKGGRSLITTFAVAPCQLSSVNSQGSKFRDGEAIPGYPKRDL